MTKKKWVDKVDSKIRTMLEDRQDGFPRIEIQDTGTDRSSYNPTENLCKISYVAALKFYDFFSCMMCHASFNQTGLDLKDNQGLFDWSDIGTTNFEVKLPSDHLKNAEFLAECAIVFIALHELGHYQRGHTHFLNLSSGQPSQATVDCYNADSWLISQVLEIDADYFAYMHLSKMVDRILKFESALAADKMYAKTHWLMQLCYGVLLIRENILQSDNNQNIHPVGLTRYRYLISNSLVDAGPKLKENVFQALDDVLEEYDLALQTLFNSGSKIRLHVPADDGHAHDQKVFDLYENMLPEILESASSM